jgi:hypothetical protein
VNTGALRVERSGIELPVLSGRRAVNDDPAKIPQTKSALGGVLAPEHLEDSVNALSMCEIANRLLVIVLPVVDSMLQSEFLDSRQLFF